MRFTTLAEWLAWQETLHPRAIDLGLERVRSVFLRMEGRRPPPFTITVGGTNGKGSCVAMLDAMLRNAGYRVGCYTSPHLLRYNERICIAGSPVEDAAICEAFDRVDQARGETSLSFFEFGTLAALSLFGEAQLDVQVLEVGLGGRLDAVNIVDADAALIASIDIDHQEWLGKTRSAIGLEKAAIFRSGRPAVVGDPDVPSTVLDYAARHGIPLHVQGREFRFQTSGERWTWFNQDARLTDLPLPGLAGQHQLRNAAAVIHTLHRIRADLPVGPQEVAEGLAKLRLAGRFQFFSGPPSVLLDVAHNPQAARVLAEQLRERFAGRRIHAVFAVMRDKDIEGVVEAVKDLVHCWYLAPLKMTRAASEEQLLGVFRKLGIDSVEYGFADARSAFLEARHDSDSDAMVLGFGSFFLVSDYLAHFA